MGWSERMDIEDLIPIMTPVVYQGKTYYCNSLPMSLDDEALIWDTESGEPLKVNASLIQLHKIVLDKLRETIGDD